MTIVTNWKTEKDKFLETYDLPRLKQEKIENKNRSITSNQNLPTKKSPGPDDFSSEILKAK